MDFYKLYGSGSSVESIRKSIAEQSRAPEEKLETAAHFMRRYNPAYIPTQEQKEQQKHRREVQQRMVAKMTALLENKAEADQSLPSTGHLPRELQAFFGRPMDRKAFDDLNNDLSSKDRRKVADACYNVIKEACKGLTADSLRNMTDEQVIEHLEQITYANYLFGESDTLLGIGRDGVDFTKEQRQEMLRLREELQAPLWMTEMRANMISEPYYAQFPPESMFAMDGMKPISASFDRKFNTLWSFLKEGHAYISSFAVDLGDQMAREGVNGVPMEQITWILQDGSSQSKNKKAPSQALRYGPALAVFPDNSVKAFAFEMKDGVARWVSGGPEMISSRVDSDMQALPELSKQLKQADHWYVRGSQEFKDVRTAMEKVEKELQTLGKKPTDYQRKRLAEQMQKLLDVCQTYLNHKSKEGEDSLSSTAWERIDAVAAIGSFAKNKVEQLGLLDKMTELIRYDQREAEALGDLKNGKSSWLGDTHQARMSADPQQDAEAREELEKAKKNLEKYIPKHELNLDTPDQNKARYLQKLVSYNNITIPRSNAAFDVGKMHQDTTGRIARMMSLTSSNAPLTGANAQDARTALAQMILVEMVMKERGEVKPNLDTGLIKAGQLESFLGHDIAGKSGETMMLQNIQNSQAFLEMTENLSGKSFRDFFMEDKVQDFSDKVMEELFPHKEQIKAAQEGKFQAPQEEQVKAPQEEQVRAPQEEQVKAPQEMPEKSLEEMLKAYKKIKLPRSSERVEGLYQNTVDRIAPLLNQTSAEPLTGASAQEARTTMAQMILVDMVLKERLSNMFDASKSEMKVGPLESFLDRDIAGKPGMTMMLQNIQNSQGFLEMTENLSGKGFQNFFLENKARNVSGKIMSELFPHKEQIKAAQQPQVNKTAAQNAPKEQKKDAAPKMK